jgi:16S rRNA (uracil1498-N3)-methyltransferase
VEFALGDDLAAEPCANLTLVLAIFKFDRMEWVIEKCAEIGVARIIPVIARRTDAHLASAAIKRHERWQRIARQAAEQSRRVSPPEIAPPVRLKDLGKTRVLPESAGGIGTVATRIVLSEFETGMRLRDIFGSRSSDAMSVVVLAVGPEGGWTDDEMQWFRQNGWAAASLGNTILRAETAAIVATALALDATR